MRFMRHRWLYYSITSLLLLISISSLIFFKFKPSIDFIGGSLLEIKIVKKSELEGEIDTEILLEESIEEVSIEAEIEEVEQKETDEEPSIDSYVVSEDQIRENISEVYEVSTIQSSGVNQYIVRGTTIDNLKKNEAIVSLSEFGSVQELRFETIGPTMGKELLTKTIIAVIFVAILICAYVWMQFKNLKYGICAILAMFHDSIILMGSFSLLGHLFGMEVDVLFVTALLTTLSFSIHDTVVIYHRIKEVQQKNSKMNFEIVADIAITETLSRSINNSMTIIIMLLALVLLGGETIRSFSIALLIGAVVGTYSSTFTAVPLLLLWDDLRRKLKARK